MVMADNPVATGYYPLSNTLQHALDDESQSLISTEIQWLENIQWILMQRWPWSLKTSKFEIRNSNLHWRFNQQPVVYTGIPAELHAVRLAQSFQVSASNVAGACRGSREMAVPGDVQRFRVQTLNARSKRRRKISRKKFSQYDLVISQFWQFQASPTKG